MKTGPLLPKSDVGHQSNTERVAFPDKELHEIDLSEPHANRIHFIEGHGLRNHDIAEESIPSFLFGSSQEMPLQIDESYFWIPKDLELSVQEFHSKTKHPFWNSPHPSLNITFS
jgi:hypothetical protein